MERKHYILLIGCFLAISVALLALYAFSPLSSGVYIAGFDRNFLKTPVLSQKAVLDLKVNSFYIAGTANDKIYLGNLTAPFILSFTDLSLKELVQVKLKIMGLDSIKYIERFRLTVDSPYFFLFNGAMPQILRGNLESREAKPIMTDDGYYFDKAVPLGPSSFVFRSYSRAEQGYELAKITIDPPYCKFEPSLLQKQLDGIFCLDGQLHYSKYLNRLVYHHFYRNELVVSDSNLNLIYRGHTIDTFSRARVKVATIKENETMITGTPVQVNIRGSVFEKYLFLNSNLLAKNEEKKSFFTNAVIDVYDLTDSRYINSFYIPYYQGKQPIDFLFFKHHLAVIYDQYLILYDFKFYQENSKRAPI